MLLSACAVTGLTVLAMIEIVKHNRIDSPSTTVWLIAVAVSSTALVPLAVTELLAKPLFGAGPDLVFDWGAIVGVAAAGWAMACGWSGLATLTVYRRISLNVAS
jgi:hypothetical protein